MSTTTYSPGLEGVTAGETAICTVEGGLSYRGYKVGDLAENCTFDEVAYLLLHGELPTTIELKSFQSRVAAARRLPPPLKDLLAALPRWTTPLDALRTAVSALAHFDQDTSDNTHDANIRKAERLMAQIPVVIADYYWLARGDNPRLARKDLSHAANFLYMLRGAEPSADEVKALDVSLILYAEHEFNASTFAARVIVSTLSDLHSGITGAIGALKGPLHGGANEKVVDILQEAGSPESAESWIREALARKARIMGFGHRVYKTGDVRAGILKSYARRAAEIAGTLQLEETAEIIENVMAAEKNMYPNLDWPAGRLYQSMKLEIPLYTPIFAMSRITGWAAHIVEQLDHNRLIRPARRNTLAQHRELCFPLQKEKRLPGLESGSDCCKWKCQKFPLQREPAMPIAVLCPGCSARLNAPDSAAGKNVKCPKCGTLMSLPAATPPEPEPEPEFEVVEKSPPPPPRKKRFEEDDDDAAPITMKQKDEDEDDPPRRKRRDRDDDDDEDERPAKRKKSSRRDSWDDDDLDSRATKRRRGKRRSSAENPLAKLGSMGGFAAIVGVLWVIGFIIALISPELILIPLGISYLVALAGSVWLLIVAFSDSVVQGLLCLFVPFYGLIYLISHWDECKPAFLLWLTGFVMLMITSCGGGAIAGARGKGKDFQAQSPIVWTAPTAA